MPKTNKEVSFVPPEDVRAFWKDSCCGPGTIDEMDSCGFCGETHKECADAMSRHVQLHPDYVHDGNILGDGQDGPDGDMACGGSGFWCHECGRFWAQDSCGNSSGEEHQASDGAKMLVRDGKVYCVCGEHLMRQRIMPEENE